MSDLLKRLILAVRSGRSTKEAITQGFVAQIMIFAITLLNGIVMARTLGPAGRGEFVAMLLLPGLMASLISFGVPNGVGFYMRSMPESARVVFGVGLFLSACLGAIAAIFAWQIAPWWLEGERPEIIRAAVLIAWTTPVIMIDHTAVAALEATGRFTARNLRFLFQSFATLALMLVLLAFGWLTPFTAAAAAIASGTLATASVLRAACRKVAPSLRDLRGVIAEIVGINPVPFLRPGQFGCPVCSFGKRLVLRCAARFLGRPNLVKEAKIIAVEIVE